jgi:hypothetical protein
LFDRGEGSGFHYCTFEYNNSIYMPKLHLYDNQSLVVLVAYAIFCYKEEDSEKWNGVFMLLINMLQLPEVQFNHKKIPLIYFD